MSSVYDVVVVGAGISGLACAHRLHQKGASVLVLERAPRVGGMIGSQVLEDGTILELGPQTVRSADPELFAHLTELDLAVVEANPRNKRRYLCHDGRVVAAPSGLLSALRSPLLSWRGKLRLLSEPLRSAYQGSDLSVHEFFSRRLGLEVADHLVDPMISGIHAGDVRQLSARNAFPALWNGVQEHGSLLGMARRRRRNGPSPKPRAKLFSFAGGLGAWPRALAAQLGARLRTDHRVRNLARAGRYWRIASTDPAGRLLEVRADALVLATPSHVTAGLLGAIAPGEAAMLGDIPYAPVALVHLSYERDAVRHPLDGFGMLVASRENRAVLGSLWISSLFDDRCPSDRVLTTTFIGGAKAVHRVGMPDAELIGLAHAQHTELLGAQALPTLSRVYRWNQAIPQYEFGHDQRIVAAERLEASHPGLRVVGNWRTGVSVPDTWKAGRRAADELIAGAWPFGVHARPTPANPPRPATVPRA